MKFLHALIFLFSISGVSAQLSSSDVTTLNREMLRLVNELRLSKGLRALESASVLNEAATIHSSYMSKTGILAHEEMVLKDPADRIKKTGGKEFEYSGENILITKPQEFPVKKEKLNSLAEEMFSIWKNSPPHFKNMTDPEYTHIGLGFVVDPKTKGIYATQVFAKKGAVIENQLSKNAFGILERSNECEGLLHNKENLLTNIGNSIYIEENEVILAYHNIQTVKQVFEAPNDGIAVDIISPYQLACGTPNQLDISSIYDGTLLRPVYKDELLNGNRAESDYRLISKIGELPAGMNTNEVSISLVFIKNGRECAYNFPVEIPNKDYELRDLTLSLDNPQNASFSTDGIIFSEDVEFDFKRNAFTGKYTKITPDFPLEIHSIDIKSYSSVEGPSEHNEFLQRKRADFIREQLHKNLKFSDSIVRAEAAENWQKMLFQLEYFDYSSVAALPKDSIKNFLKVNKSPFFDSLLFTQRHSYATIHYKGELDSIERDGDVTIIPMNLRTAIITQNFNLANKALYEMYYQQEQEPDFSVLFEQSVFSEICSRPEIVKNVAAVLSRIAYDMPYETTEFLASWLGRMKGLSKDAQFNLINLYNITSRILLNEWDVPSQRLSKVIYPRKFEKTANDLANSVLIINFHLSAIHYYGQINDSKNIDASFDYISGYFNKNSLSEREENDLVLFYNSWSTYGLTIKQLLPKVDNKDFSAESAMILAKTYSGFQYWRSDNNSLEKISDRFFELDPVGWCEWINENKQLKRYSYIKSKACESCLSKTE